MHGVLLSASRLHKNCEVVRIINLRFDRVRLQNLSPALRAAQRYRGDELTMLAIAR